MGRRNLFAGRRNGSKAYNLGKKMLRTHNHIGYCRPRPERSGRGGLLDPAGEPHLEHVEGQPG